MKKFLLLILTAVLAISGYNIHKDVISHYEDRVSAAALNNRFISAEEKKEEQQPSAAPASNQPVAEATEENFYEGPEIPELTVDFQGLKDVNDRVVGVLSIPELGLVEPVVQSIDNSDYLERNIDGSASRAGSLIFGAKNGIKTAHPIIFGHNMKDGSKFGCLRNIEAKENGQIPAGHFFFFYTEEEVLVYEMKNMYQEKNIFDEAGLVSLIEDGAGEGAPEIITLLTCDGPAHGTGRRMVSAELVGIRKN